MIREQRWTPDTCAKPEAGDVCSVLETWDDTESEAARTHSFKIVEKKCSLHRDLEGKELYAALYEQNRRKNVVFAVVQSIKTIPAHQFSWKFDNDFNLTVDCGSNLSTTQKNQLRAVCDINFGPNRVKVG